MDGIWALGWSRPDSSVTTSAIQQTLEFKETSASEPFPISWSAFHLIKQGALFSMFVIKVHWFFNPRRSQCWFAFFFFFQLAFEHKTRHPCMEKHRNSCLFFFFCSWLLKDHCNFWLYCTCFHFSLAYRPLVYYKNRDPLQTNRCCTFSLTRSPFFFFFWPIFSFAWHLYSRGPGTIALLCACSSPVWQRFKFKTPPMVLDGEHVKSAVSKNLSFARLALELLQTVNGDMCKVSEDGFSSMFAALVVLIQLGVGSLSGGLGWACRKEQPWQ